MDEMLVDTQHEVLFVRRENEHLREEVDFLRRQIEQIRTMPGINRVAIKDLFAKKYMKNRREEYSPTTIQNTKDAEYYFLKWCERYTFEYADEFYVWLDEVDNRHGGKLTYSTKWGIYMLENG